MKHTVLLATSLLLSLSALAQPAENAAKDQGPSAQEAQLAAVEKAIAPYVAKARQTYPAAKARFLSGLPRGETFFVTTRLKGQDGTMEQVFVRVSNIAGSQIAGAIASQMMLVKGYRPGQEYSFNDANLIDWLIAKPDGSEEGNVVGKFLDTYKQ